VATEGARHCHWVKAHSPTASPLPWAAALSFTAVMGREGPTVARRPIAVHAHPRPGAGNAARRCRGQLPNPVRAALIATLTGIGILTFFAALVVLFPLLGYATWRS